MGAAYTISPFSFRAKRIERRSRLHAQEIELVIPHGTAATLIRESAASGEASVVANCSQFDLHIYSLNFIVVSPQPHNFDTVRNRCRSYSFVMLQSAQIKRLFMFLSRLSGIYKG